MEGRTLSMVRGACMLAVAAIFTSGCVATEQPWTRERQEAVTKRSYADVAPQKAVGAAEEVMRRIDPAAITFEFTGDGFNATRKVYAFLIFGEISGNYSYSVRAKPAGGGSVLEFRTYANLSTLTTTGTYPNGGGAFVQGNGAYDLFFARVDHLLGKRQDWVSCKDAPKVLGVKVGQTEPLCFGARESAP